jgi:pimeloyl-ACP methyl ester carboxylesterase
MVGYQRDWMWHGWQTRYTYLRSQTTAENPPILFLHGFGGSIGHWRKNLPFFAEHHPVYALDLVGFGASEKVPIAYDANFWTEQVYDFWQTFLNTPVILVGNSIGSLIALNAALKHPEMVQGLVMISVPDPSVRQDLIPAWCRPIVSAIESLFTGDWLLKPLFYWVRQPKVVRPWAKIAYANPEAVTDELVEILSAPARDRWAAEAFGHILRSMVHPSFGPRVSATLPLLEIPILLMWGKQDRMVPPGFADDFAALNPRIQLLELENAGHCPQDELPEVVNQAIQIWFQREYGQSLTVPGDFSLEKAGVSAPFAG